MITNVYVDAFNLYYRALKGTPYRWLDLRKMCEKLLPQNTIQDIKYFTAVVESRPGDPNQQQRQQAYLRALQTIPGLTIHYGLFMTNPQRLPKTNPPPRTVEVLRTEEKGSDVNLATQLLVDGFKGRYEVAVVVSNDSDLKAPIEAVRNELHLPVGVVVPGSEKQIRRSALPADFYRRIRLGVLRDCQLPPVITDPHGTVRKPRTW
jgi:uncharacterized LabA/DUF88 family protein